jgi:hypothetical protein
MAIVHHALKGPKSIEKAHIPIAGGSELNPRDIERIEHSARLPIDCAKLEDSLKVEAIWNHFGPRTSGVSVKSISSTDSLAPA